ncbi:MAG TPA: PAS domain-containing protein, partial [Vicinamibacterales bacterium]|nr:PAS domain-containing protein [Vicinamibacterales bacterium]
MDQVETAIGEATLRWFRDSASFGMLTTDAALQITSWNRWMVSATGISEDAAIGRHLLDVLPSFIERG